VWRVTFADLTYRYRQFLIAVLGAGVVLAMAILMAGLANGFSFEVDQTVGGVGAQNWVMTQGSHGRLASVALFPQTATTLIAHTPGVTRADPLAVFPQQVAEVGGKIITVTIMGVRIGGMGDPTPTSGQGLSGSNQVVADTRAGAANGTVITLGALHFHVVGQIENRTLLGGTPIIYMPLSNAQSLALGGRPFVTAVVTQGRPGAVPQGLSVYSNEQVNSSTLAALSGAASSINNTKFLMYVVAAIIIAALLYVSALQRVQDFAVLKALGSSSVALFGSLAAQAVVITLIAAAFAMIISSFMHGIFAQPVAVPGSAYATLPIVAVIVGLLSSLVALRRATGADPASAFG
jgi:putative ABC transport system permease protein